MARIVERPAEVTDLLTELGVSIEVFHDSLATGEIARDTCDSDDAIGAGGFLAYTRSNKRLRKRLAPAGWTRSNFKGLPVVVSPDGETAITVEGGDEGTGLPNKPVTTNYGRGRATKELIEQNRVQPDFFDGPTERVTVLKPTTKTWFLLRYRTTVHGDVEIVRSELSLPESIAENGFVEKWSIRIIVPDLRLTPSPRNGSTAPDQTEEIEITPKRRQR
jgi:hypothetical protein